jgi:hypothetical protein
LRECFHSLRLSTFPPPKVITTFDQPTEEDEGAKEPLRMKKQLPDSIVIQTLSHHGSSETQLPQEDESATITSSNAALQSQIQLLEKLVGQMHA